MDKEEIIIDGVNVKDCKRRIGKNSYCRYFKRPCTDNNFNCIWKQHGRLKEENEELKKYIKDLQVRKDRYYLQVLEYEKQISGWISFYIKIRDIILGNYEILESQGLQELRRIISEVTND